MTGNQKKKHKTGEDKEETGGGGHTTRYILTAWIRGLLTRGAGQALLC